MNKNSLVIQLYSFNYKWLDKGLKQIKILFSYFQKYSIPTNNTISIISLPSQITSYTVIRSPHVDKRSGETYKKKIYKKIISIDLSGIRQQYLVESLLKSLMHLNWIGVELKMSLNYSTKINN
jgi:ribosomal protein S10